MRVYSYNMKLHRQIASALLLVLSAQVGTHANAASVELGQRLMLRCQTCHAVQSNAPDKVGPSLYKVFGRKAGALPGYNYSQALQQSKIIWTDATLDKWLTKPSGLVPGTAMAFVGLPKAEERKALIAYLKRVTK